MAMPPERDAAHPCCIEPFPAQQAALEAATRPVCMAYLQAAAEVQGCKLPTMLCQGHDAIIGDRFAPSQIQVLQAPENSHCLFSDVTFVFQVNSASGLHSRWTRSIKRMIKASCCHSTFRRSSVPSALGEAAEAEVGEAIAATGAQGGQLLAAAAERDKCAVGQILDNKQHRLSAAVIHNTT